MNKYFALILLLISGPLFAAFAAVESSTSGNAGFGTTFELGLPATIGADSVIIGCIALDGNNSPLSTSETGVSLLGGGEAGTGGGGASAACFCKAADGTEDGTSWTIENGAVSENGEYISYSWTGTFDNTCSSVEAATFATATSATSDPPSLNPAGWDVEDTVWLLVSGIDWNTGKTLSSYPTDCDDNQINEDGASGTAEIATCTRNFASASWDPGVFTWDTSDDVIAGTMAIRPA